MPATILIAAALGTITIRWSGGVTGRAFLVLSTDLSREPRLSVSATFGNTAQIIGVDVKPSDTSVSFWDEGILMGSIGYPRNSLAGFPGYFAAIQAVVTPYEEYKRADGHTIWMPAFDTFTYSHDQDSYGWSNVSTEFGRAKALTAAGALYSAPVNHSWPLASPLELHLDHQQAAYPPRPPETKWSKYVSIRSPKLSAFWGRPVNVSAWVLLPAGFDAHPDARYPLILNAGHYSYQRMRGWSETPPSTVTLPTPLRGDPDDCYYCSSGGGSCPDCEFHDDFKQLYAHYFYRNWSDRIGAATPNRQSAPFARLTLAPRGGQHRWTRAAPSTERACCWCACRPPTPSSTTATPSTRTTSARVRRRPTLERLTHQLGGRGR